MTVRVCRRDRDVPLVVTRGQLARWAGASQSPGPAGSLSNRCARGPSLPKPDAARRNSSRTQPVPWERPIARRVRSRTKRRLPPLRTFLRAYECVYAGGPRRLRARRTAASMGPSFFHFDFSAQNHDSSISWRALSPGWKRPLAIDAKSSVRGALRMYARTATSFRLVRLLSPLAQQRAG
jgi:hypothetical protein